MMARPGALLLSCVLGAWGCEALPTLTVRVRSGLRAEHELRHVRVRVLEGSVRCDTEGERTSAGRSVDASEQQPLRDGALTVAELRDLPRGIYTVHVLARRPGDGGPESGAVLIERCVVTTLTNDRVLRVPLTTDCINVRCPAPAGSPAFTECLAGRCVDPRCDPDDPTTVELCCDRSMLGALCDTEPTLCRASTDCAPPRGCFGAASCEDGVCVEPADDTCDDAHYCDATTEICTPIAGPPADGGPRDGGMDAFVEPPDAFVPVGTDAPFPDAWAPDAFVMPDAWAPDAFVPLGLDAPFPDAFTAPDAHVAPDAYAAPDASVPRAEDCTSLGDEDADGSADCADAECSTTAICFYAGCGPLPPEPDPPLEDIPRPRHWYRGDRRIVSSAMLACAWPDRIGTSHFLADLGAPPAAPAALAIEVNADASMSAPDDLGIRRGGGYTIFLATQRPGTSGMTTTVLHARERVSGRMIIQTRQGHALPASFGVSVREGNYAAGTEPTTTPTIETLEVGPIGTGDSISSRVSYRRNRSPVSLGLTGGSDMAGGGAAGDVEVLLGGAGVGPILVFEILVYDGALSAVDRDRVEAYLHARYLM